MKMLADHSRRAFSLVEVTLALGVAAFCLVPLLGLLPVGVNSNRAALEQTAAATAAAGMIADLQATPVVPVATPSPQYGIPVPAVAGDPLTHTIFLRADGTVAVPWMTASTAWFDIDAIPAQNPRYRVTLTFVLPTAAYPRAATGVRTLVTWPALADPTASSEPVNFAGSFDTFTTLDRH